MRKLVTFLIMLLAGFTISTFMFSITLSNENGVKMKEEKNKKTEKNWKELLSPKQFSVLRNGATEKPFSGIYNDFTEKGLYRCGACGAPLFKSETKYDHGTGWPSFTESIEGAVKYVPDNSFGMKRIEIRCAECDGHLGHVFDDGPLPTGKHYCVNSLSLNFEPAEKEKTMEKLTLETAYFAAGCFWGVEFKFSQQKGVKSTDVGYMGGITENPTYRDVCSDATGHAEAVMVIFDNSQTDFETLVRYFFTIHDPTQIDRQGPDVGSQYRSAIFFVDAEQEKIALKVKQEFSAKYAEDIATEITPAGTFFMAEDYHQDYLKKQGKESCDI